MGRWQDLTDGVMKACRDTFTTAFLYLPKAGGSHAMSGIFDKAFVSVQMLDGAAVQSIGPTMGVRVADLATLSVTPGPGDKIQVGSTVYFIDEYRPDGEAGGVFILNEKGDA